MDKGQTWDRLSEAKELFDDFKAKEIIHVIEYSAYEKLKELYDELKFRMDGLEKWQARRVLNAAVLLQAELWDFMAPFANVISDRLWQSHQK